VGILIKCRSGHRRAERLVPLQMSDAESRLSNVWLVTSYNRNSTKVHESGWSGRDT
jgi:hypothetical protein